MMTTGESSQVSRRVNELLANARAEHTRHVQNLTRAARHAPSPTVYSPTLPFLLPTPVIPEPAPAAQHPAHPQPKKPAGPSPPRSWVSHSSPSNPGVDLLSAAPISCSLRRELLSSVFRRLPTPWNVEEFLTLVDWCLLSLLDPFDADAIFDLPAHLRRRLVRLAALRCPLTREQLEVCWGDGYSGTGGEAIIIGREAYGALRQLLHALRRASEAPAPEEAWDTPLHLLAAPPIPVLHTLVLVKTPLPSLALLPRTLTHLSLVRCTFDSIRTARNLPKSLPLLEWIEVNECEGIDGAWFEGVDWGRWAGLVGVRLVPAPLEGLVVDGGVPRVREKENWQERVRKRIENGRMGEVEICFD
ncbi:hypothetical protein DACRYDRAFT_92647 [Dacryopinax primogenitus]|uniref:Uncharacterized protein n=1 Tax=Dacryopinax primogenitus (strain DJM 731) TaxID=1858805 RepID=M5GEB2_DACPD|nr:uncharacterized protein DACRYDRAFT_92647 [Dacryopinax primogenitus]EJU05247.1 hypothetical protein DACRYDRAFT_92647 [Dacryopinax primogenitus]